jgi:hypothetical protein
MRALILVITCWMVASAHAATWYVDSMATGTRKGTSWADAWTNVDQISGISPGDTVYNSGGPSGGSRTYTLSTAWKPIGGNSTNAVTYKIGQDSLHNGIAIFNVRPLNDWISGAIQSVVISGDAGDGKMHFQLGNLYRPITGDGSSNLRISYVNCGQKADGFNFNGVSRIEVDHCYLYKLPEAPNGDDRAMYIANNGTTWDESKVHDNTFYMPRTDDGLGDDCIQGAANSFSFYNNIVIGYKTSYTGGQHQDGIQPLGGKYIKCYNNYFQDIANYPVFGDAYYGDFTHFWVYNNIMIITSPALRESDPPQGVAIGPDGGSFQQLKRWPKFTDVVVANNLIVDYGKHAAVNLQNNPGQRSTFSQCSVVNNIAVNSGGLGTESTVITATNVNLHLSNGSGHFVRYIPSQPNNDFHLLATDKIFKGKGTSMSSYFNTNKDGTTRPAGPAWDIGPY